MSETESAQVSVRAFFGDGCEFPIEKEGRLERGEGSRVGGWVVVLLLGESVHGARREALGYTAGGRRLSLMSCFGLTEWKAKHMRFT